MGRAELPRPVYGFHAAGDVRFTMLVGIASTVCVRLLLSVILGVWLGLGVIGIAWAMVGDWIARGIAFYLRYRQGTWKALRVI